VLGLLYEWETSYTNGDPIGNTYAPIGSVGTVYIHVKQTGGARTCNTYTLQIWN